MNEYKYGDLSIGDEERFSYRVTEESLDSFKNLTGDINPLHIDAEYAKAHGFNDRLTYGLLTASLMSTLGGVYLPGKYCIIHQVESCKFLHPVYVGDQLEVIGTVKELNDCVQQMVIKVEIINQSQEKVVRGLLKVGFLE